MDLLNKNITIYRRKYACMQPVHNPSYIYASSYQFKVAIAGTFIALSSTIVAKVLKLAPGIGKNYGKSLTLFNQERMQSHEGWHSEVSPPKKKHFKTILHQHTTFLRFV